LSIQKKNSLYYYLFEILAPRILKVWIRPCGDPQIISQSIQPITVLIWRFLQLTYIFIRSSAPK